MRMGGKRLERSIDDLGRIGETPRGGLTRLALTDDDRRGRDWMVAHMREAGLRVTVDQMGNIFGERAGAEALPPVLMGSHVDSVPTGGKYDGQLGVLCGLETIRALNDHRIRTRRPVTLVIFTNEEGARFQPAMIASGVMAGKIALEDAYNTRDADGIRLADELERIGALGSGPCVARTASAARRGGGRAAAASSRPTGASRSPGSPRAWSGRPSGGRRRAACAPAASCRAPATTPSTWRRSAPRG